MSLLDDSKIDWAEMLSLDEFATQAAFNVVAGDDDPKTIPVLFVNEFDAALTSNLPTESAKPFVIATSEDVADATHKSSVTVNGIVFDVIAVQAGTGPSTKLVLSRNADQ